MAPAGPEGLTSSVQFSSHALSRHLKSLCAIVKKTSIRIRVKVEDDVLTRWQALGSLIGCGCRCRWCGGGWWCGTLAGRIATRTVATHGIQQVSPRRAGVAACTYAGRTALSINVLCLLTAGRHVLDCLPECVKGGTRRRLHWRWVHRYGCWLRQLRVLEVVAQPSRPTLEGVPHPDAACAKGGRCNEWWSA